MALTPEEKLVARTATCQDHHGDYWGAIGRGWSPEGLVALMRGAHPVIFGVGPRAKYHLTFQRCLVDGTTVEAVCDMNAMIAWEAMYDCMEWAGFSRDTPMQEYFDAYRRYGITIFPED